MTINKLDNEYIQYLRAASSEGDGVLEVSSPELLKKYIDPAKLQARLDRVQEMEYDKAQIEYLQTVGKFSDAFLKEIQAVPPRAIVLGKGDNLKVRVEGPKIHLALWEVPIAIQLHDLWYVGIFDADQMDPGFIIGEGARRLQTKLDYLRNSGVRFVEDGTRTRYTWDWYSLILQSLMGDARDLLLGTTNPAMAMAFALPLIAYDDSLTGATKGVRVSATSVEELSTLAGGHQDTLVVSGVNAFEMAHLHSHLGDRLVFEWGSDLSADVGPAGRALPLAYHRV